VKRWIGVCLFAWLTASPCVALAQQETPSYLPSSEELEPAPEAGIETHDGLMLRFAIGPGGGVVKQFYPDIDGLKVDLSGGGLLWSFDLGAGVTDRLTVQARLGQLLLLGPSFSAQNARPGSPESEGLPEGSSVSATLVGAGITYHLMPINMYVTAIGGLSFISLHIADLADHDQEVARTGFGVNLDVGKEWWITNQIGIGVAARFWWATGGAEYRGAELDRTLLAFGLLFSMTYQ